MVLGTDAVAIDTFVGLAAERGFTETGLSIDAAGARREDAREQAAPEEHA